MFKLKLTEPGWESFSSTLGITEYLNGVSVEDVIPSEILRTAAMMRCEAVGFKGKGDPFVAARDAFYSPAIPDDGPTTYPTLPADDHIGGDDSGNFSGKQPEFVDLEEEEAKGPLVFYTQAELEAIADKEGINGLRPIGNRLDVKATAIVDLMNKILQAQAREQIVPVVTAPAVPTMSAK